MVIGQGLHEGRGFLGDVGVVTDLRTKYRRLQQGSVANSQVSAIFGDLLMVDGEDLGNRQAGPAGQLFRQFSVEAAEFFVRTAIGIHDLRANRPLGRNDVVDVVFDRFPQEEAL